MKRVVFGILAVLLGAGCALETGDPGGTSQPAAAATAEPKQNTAVADNPEPSPWVPPTTIPTINPNARKASGRASGTTSDQGSESSDDNPEPAPWNGQLPGDSNGEGSAQQPGDGSGRAGIDNADGVSVNGTVQLLGNSNGRSTGL
jgi:hypothetical protein